MRTDRWTDRQRETVTFSIPAKGPKSNLPFISILSQSFIYLQLQKHDNSLKTIILFSYYFKYGGHRINISALLQSFVANVIFLPLFFCLVFTTDGQVRKVLLMFPCNSSTLSEPKLFYLSVLIMQSWRNASFSSISNIHSLFSLFIYTRNLSPTDLSSIR